MTVTDLIAVLPIIILIVGASFILLLDVFSKRKLPVSFLAVLVLIGAFLSVLNQNGQDLTAFNNFIKVDGFAVFLNSLFLISGVLAVALSHGYVKKRNMEQGEFYTLFLFSISGMLLMAMAAELIVIFLALELLSIPLYVLAAFARPQLDSEEAGLKYFLLGAFSGSFVVFGIALVFGATGTTALSDIVVAINDGAADISLLLIGAGLILVGFGFKIAVVPFHMWTPDVYHGAPTNVTAFMAVGAKAAGFAAIMRVFIASFPQLAQDLMPVIWVLAAITMFAGNIIAIAQTNIKRMLAYSSIAHAGYILMALVPFGLAEVAPDSVASALFYLLAYMITNFGAWAIVIMLEKSENRGLSLRDYAGLGKKYPALAAAMTVFMLSFTGVPPTLGFVGKFYLFRTVLSGGNPAFTWLAIIGVLTSLISAYYYLRIVIIMYMEEGEPDVASDRYLNLTTGVTAVLTVVLSLAAAPLFKWASSAVLTLF